MFDMFSKQETNTMAKKQATANAPKAPKKSNIIRELHAENPLLGPQDLAALIKKEKGVEVTPGAISTVLSNDRKKGKTPRRQGRPAKAPSSMPVYSELVGKLEAFRTLIAHCGGIQQTRQVLDILESIVG